jgi:leishmanolysin
MSASKFLSVFLTITLLIAFGNAFNGEKATCHHDNQEFSPEFMEVDDRPTGEEGRQLSGYPNIRLYSYFGYMNGGSSAFQSYVINDLVPAVTAYYQGALQIKYPLRSLMTVSSSSVCGFATPSVLQSGVNADHFFFFTADAEATNFLATSTYCQLSSGTNRPIMSIVKLNTNYLMPYNGDHLVHENNMNLLMHEMVHSFGFSKNLYPYFLDSNGNVMTGHIKYVNLQGSTRTVLDVPFLTNRLRSYFGCSSLPGLYLEDNGNPDLTAVSHLERRFFLLDFMTSGALDGSRITDVSLGVLEASGWYSVNYNYAEPNYFGEGQGCGFFNNYCSYSNPQFDEYCGVTQQRGCWVGGRAGGKCTSDKLSENCQYIDPYVNYDCNNPNAGQYTRVPELQTFGRTAGSKCFEGTLSTMSGDTHHSFCFKFACVGSGSSTQVEVQVGNRQILCNTQGQVTVPGYQGTITCPDPLHFCQTAGLTYCPRNCMGRGQCSNGQCYCYNGFTGIDCSERY